MDTHTNEIPEWVLTETSPARRAWEREFKECKEAYWQDRMADLYEWSEQILAEPNNGFSLLEHEYLSKRYDEITRHLHAMPDNPVWFPAHADHPRIMARFAELKSMSREELMAEIEADYVIFCTLYKEFITESAPSFP